MAGTVAAEVTSASGVIAASSLFYFLLVPALTLWFVYWKLSRRHMLELAETLPGPDGLPIIGNLMDLVGSSHCKFSYIYILNGFIVWKKSGRKHYFSSLLPGSRV